MVEASTTLSKLARLSSAMVSNGWAPFQGVLGQTRRPCLRCRTWYSSLSPYRLVVVPGDARRSMIGGHIAVQHHAAAQYSRVVPAVKVPAKQIFSICTPRCRGACAVAMSRPRRRSSGVEHSLGKGGVGSSILPGGTVSYKSFSQFDRATKAASICARAQTKAGFAR